MSTDKNINLVLTVAEFDAIINVMAEAPAKVSFDIIQLFLNKGQAQKKAILEQVTTEATQAA